MTEIEMIAKIRRSIEVAEDALAMAKLALYRLDLVQLILFSPALSLLVLGITQCRPVLVPVDFLASVLSAFSLGSGCFVALTPAVSDCLVRFLFC